GPADRRDGGAVGGDDARVEDLFELGVGRDDAVNSVVAGLRPRGRAGEDEDDRNGADGEGKDGTHGVAPWGGSGHSVRCKSARIAASRPAAASMPRIERMSK